MKTAVSVSLGSSRRDHNTTTELLGQSVSIRRIGVDGDFDRARQLFLELQDEVDCFGLGGAEFGVNFGDQYYKIRALANITNGVKKPVVDGTGFRAVIERSMAQFLLDNLGPALETNPERPKRTFICVASGRYDLMHGFHEAGFEIKCGDPGFILGLPITSTNYWLAKLTGRFLIPLFVQAPFKWLYPTGVNQHENRPKFQSWYQWADVIADDFHYIKRHLPLKMEGKIIVTNTTTETDRQMLTDRGARYLVTSTPNLGGRTFGTNVIEAALTAAAGKGRRLTTEEIRHAIESMGIRPAIYELNPE